MHDLVHDLARLLIDDEILDSNKARGWAYRYAWLTDCTKPLKSLMDLPVMIRALHFWDCPFKSLEGDAFLPAKFLRVLDLSGCYTVCLPDSIGELVHLRYLNAPRIQSEMLPGSFTNLSELIYLNLSGADISALPDSIGEMKGLMHLDISGCEFMHKLPESFVNLKSLVYLDLSNLRRIKITAKDFGGLTNIQHLNLSNNSSLGSDVFEGLQEVISSLTDLQYLDLSGCRWTTRISSLFDRICTLPNLVHLDLSHSWGPVRVPESIGNLKKLHTLDLSGCWNLEVSPECMLKMESIKVLTGYSVARSKWLLLDFPVDGGESRSYAGLLRHVNTDELRICSLENVMSAEEVQNIKLNGKRAIKYLSLEWTRDARRFVEDVQVLGELVPPETLVEFELTGYQSMKFPIWIMDITSYLPRLTKIVLQDLRECDRLPPLGQLPNLGRLEVGGMDRITTIQEEGFCAGPGAFSKLREFHLSKMENLQVWNTTHSSYGQQDDDVQVFMFPDLWDLTIRDCPELRLEPCPPNVYYSWLIENSDNVLSSWHDDERGKFRNFTGIIQGIHKEFFNLIRKTMDSSAAWHAQQEKCTEPGASYRASPEELEVISSKVPLEQWRLFHHLLPTYELTIRRCTNLASSSQEIIRDLSHITRLCLEDDAQTELPKWLGELTHLDKLVIKGYRGLDAPLESMKQLTCLRKLELSDRGSMSSTLPPWLGEVTSLRELTISYWSNLSDLPDNMRRLTSLQELVLWGCPRIRALPEWLGDLASLHRLRISHCGDLDSLPESMRRLTSLEELEFSASPIIRALPEWLGELTSLEELVINECRGIESLPESIQKLARLERLTITWTSEELVRWCESVENRKKLAHIRHKHISLGY